MRESTTYAYFRVPQIPHQSSYQHGNPSDSMSFGKNVHGIVRIPYCWSSFSWSATTTRDDSYTTTTVHDLVLCIRQGSRLQRRYTIRVERLSGKRRGIVPLVNDVRLLEIFATCTNSNKRFFLVIKPCVQLYDIDREKVIVAKKVSWFSVRHALDEPFLFAQAISKRILVIPMRLLYSYFGQSQRRASGTSFESESDQSVDPETLIEQAYLHDPTVFNRDANTCRESQGSSCGA